MEQAFARGSKTRYQPSIRRMRQLAVADQADNGSGASTGPAPASTQTSSGATSLLSTLNSLVPALYSFLSTLRPLLYTIFALLSRLYPPLDSLHYARLALSTLYPLVIPTLYSPLSPPCPLRAALLRLPAHTARTLDATLAAGSYGCRIRPCAHRDAGKER